MLGVLLIIVPFVFGIETIGSSSWDAWLLGAVVGVVAIVLALLWFGFSSNRVTEGLTVMVGIVLFITPWVMGQSLLSAGAWASSIVGALLVAAAGRVLMENRKRQAAVPAYRFLGRGSMESSTSDGYR
jgi:membrane-bound ClpP family serine protease